MSRRHRPVRPARTAVAGPARATPTRPATDGTTWATAPAFCHGATALRHPRRRGRARGPARACGCSPNQLLTRTNPLGELDQVRLLVALHELGRLVRIFRTEAVR